jgi:hypothetical protein
VNIENIDFLELKEYCDDQMDQKIKEMKEKGIEANSAEIDRVYAVTQLIYEYLEGYDKYDINKVIFLMLEELEVY